MAATVNVTTTFDGDIAIINLGNTQNRLNNDFISEMNKALDSVISNENITALITTGTGKFYSNGIDLAWLATQPGVEEFFTIFHKLVIRIMTFPMPTVAMLNGHTFAGGAFLALSHDYIIMNKDRGWFSFNEVYMPSRFPEFLNEVLRIKLPQGRAQTDLASFGRRYTAEDAVKWNVAVGSADTSNLLQHTKDFLSDRLKLGQYPRDGMQEIKTDLYWPLVAKIDRVPFINHESMKSKL